MSSSKTNPFFRFSFLKNESFHEYNTVMYKQVYILLTGLFVQKISHVVPVQSIVKCLYQGISGNMFRAEVLDL